VARVFPPPPGYGGPAEALRAKAGRLAVPGCVYHPPVESCRVRTLLLIAALLAACRSDPNATEARELARLMALPAGATAADIGAGDGRFTAALAARLGPEVRLVATELGHQNVSALWKGLQAAAAGNVTVVEGATADTGLSAGSCDAIVLRRTYHHFQQRLEMAASLFRTLRPGGRLFLIEQPLVRPDPATSGLPATRGGDGIMRPQLVAELSTAGFRHERTVEPFSRQLYLVVMVKP
jgi:ubiquinone/menaquinone biosynthesis C-methylase UbiE